MTDPLHATLLDLLYMLRDADVPLILGGGYGLYLKQEAVIESDLPRLLALVPPPRATNDLDLFLRTELLADSERLQPLRTALDTLGFTVIASAQNYQFARRFAWNGREWDIKVDLLTRTPDPERYPHHWRDLYQHRVSTFHLCLSYDEALRSSRPERCC
jgi:hypothetical protein